MREIRTLRDHLQKVLGTKAERDDFNRILLTDRDAQAYSGAKGDAMPSVMDVEDNWLKQTGKLPTEGQLDAYYTQIQINDLDLALRNLNLYRDLSTRGVEQFSFKYVMRSEANEKMIQDTPKFFGVLEKELPPQGPNFNLLFYDSKTYAPIVYNSRKLSQEEWNHLNSLVKDEGWKVVRLENPTERPLRDLTGYSGFAGRQPVEFVLVRGVDNYGLSSTGLIPRNPGGHQIYRYNSWAKYPRLYKGEGGTTFYEGDHTVGNFSSNAQAEKFVKAVNEANALLRASDDVALDAHLQKNLPWSLSTFKRLHSEGHLSTEHDLRVVNTGNRIGDVEDFRTRYGNFRDLGRSEWGVQDVNKQFTQERSELLKTYVETGDAAKPVFSVAPAQLIDPIPAMDRAIQGAVRSRYWDDYRQSHVNSIIEQYGKATPDGRAPAFNVPYDELARYPTYYIYNYQSFINKAADKSRVAEMEHAIARMKQVLSAKSPEGQWIDYAKTKLYDSVYEKLGQKSADTVASSKIATERDLFSVFRTAAFQVNMGFFNPIQFFVQSQGFANIYAMSPRYAPMSHVAGTVSSLLRHNPSEEILRQADTFAQKFGWKPGQFYEAETLLRKSGFYDVGVAHAARDAMDEPNVVTTTLGKFANASTFFFNEAERWQRTTAFHTAYSEFRAKSPNASVTPERLSEILDRADALTNRMISTNNAAWQKGMASVPLQFYGYQARLMDAILGKTLTPAERFRIVGVNAILYGIPVGVVGSVTGVPAYDMIKSALLERGIDTDDNVFTQIMTEGLQGSMLAGMLGKNYNTATRYGPDGFSAIKDVINGDKTLIELATGAGGAALNRLGGALWGGLSGVPDAIKDHLNGESGYKPVLNDLVEALRAVRTGESIVDLWNAASLQKVINKNGVTIAKTDLPSAAFKALTGLTERELADGRLEALSVKSFGEYKDKVKAQYLKEMKSALREFDNGNEDAGKAYVRRAERLVIAADIAEPDYRGWATEALRDAPLNERSRETFWKNGPWSQQKARQDMFINNYNAKREQQ